MGEVVMISDNEMEVQEKGLWDRFLPKMAVRVLLVEADDSTRQIISALLTKCSYKVAAVSDGLKAWEVLKERPHKIDLILTEVELPSISGYALLSLIAEHQHCKNIPVIMMSWQDSISTVYKCMLRGATDFLVKPVRKNELRNLWQHVWRKKASSIAAGLGPPDESVLQQKGEPADENNASSDVKSSCTKSESDEERDIEYVDGPSQPESDKWLSDGITTPKQEECHPQNMRKRALDNDNMVTREGKNCDEQSREDSILQEICVREAIDLIGSFDNHIETTASICSASKFDFSPMLDLSLRRSHHPTGLSEVNNEMLNHSDASAFSRYMNKPLQPSPCCNQDTIPEKQVPNHISEFTFSSSKNRDMSQPSSELLDHQPQRNSNSVDERENKADSKLEELEDESANNSLSNGSISRAMQREAALTKFRLKRKDRCFEKKVRYESRKKLAEQRPRVKGQFVRQT